MLSSKTVYVNAETLDEIRPPRGGRNFLEIVNESAGIIYVSEDIRADSENGVPIAANSSRSYGATGNSPQAVPQGTVWIIGATAAPARQRVIVREAA